MKLNEANLTLVEQKIIIKCEENNRFKSYSLNLTL